MNDAVNPLPENLIVGDGAAVYSGKMLGRERFPFDAFGTIERPGDYCGTLLVKMWGKSLNIICFCILDDDRLIRFPVFKSHKQFEFIRHMQNGSDVYLEFTYSSIGNVVLDNIEED